MTHTDPSALPLRPSLAIRLVRWGLAALVALVLLVVLLALAAPSFLSTGFGRRQVVAVGSNAISGSIEMGDLRLSWFGGQSIAKFSLLDPEGRRVVAVDQFKTDATLWGLALGGNFHVGETQLRGVRVDLVADNTGKTNLDKAIEPASARPREKKEPSGAGVLALPLSLGGHLSISDVEIRMASPGIDPISVQELTLDLKADSINKPMALKLSATTRQGDLAGQVAIDGHIESLFNQQGKLSLDQAKANVKAQITNLPLAALDQLAKTQGLLVTALGPDVDLTLESTATTQQSESTLTVNAAHLQANLQVLQDAGTLRLVQPGKASFTLTRDFAAALTKGEGAVPRLLSDVPVEITLEQLGVPLGKPDLSHVALVARLSLGEVPLDNVPTLGKLTLKETGLAFETVSLEQGAKASAQLGLLHSGVRSDLKIELSANDFFAPGETEHPTPAKEIRAQWLTSTFGLDERVVQLIQQNPRLAVDRAKVHVRLSATRLPVGLADALLRQDGLLSDVLGPTLDLEIDNTLTLAQADVALIAKSPNLDADMALHAANHTLQTARTGSIRLTLTPALFRKLVPAEGDKRLELAANTSMTLQVERMAYPLRSGDLTQAALSSVLTVSELPLRNVAPFGDVTMRNVRISLQAPRLGDEARLDLSQGFAFAGGQGRLSSSWQVRHLLRKPDPNGNPPKDPQLFGAPTAELDRSLGTGRAITALFDPKTPLALGAMVADGSASLSGLDVTAVDRALGTNGMLGALLGPRLDATLTTNFTAAKANLALTASAPQMKANVTMAAADGTVALAAPGKVEVTVTPGGIATLAAREGMEHPPELATAFPATLTVERLALPLVGLSPGRASLRAGLVSENIRTTKTDKLPELAFRRVEAGLDTQALSRGTDVHLTLSPLADKPASDLSLKMQLSEFYNDKGEFDLSILVAKLASQSAEFPMDWIDTLAGTQGDLSSMLGSTLALQLDADLRGMQGPLTVSTTTPRSRARVAAQLHKDHLTLREPLDLDIEIGEVLSRNVLRYIHPIFISAIDADKPMKVQVDHRGLAIPLSGTSLNTLQVPSARIEIATVRMKNEGLVSEILKFLHKDLRTEIPVEFTPIQARVENGIATYERTDITIAKVFRITTYGKVDLVNDRLDLVLGFPSKTLGLALSLTQSGEDFIFEVPLKGTTRRYSVDWADAVKRLTLQLGRNILQGIGGTTSDVSGTVQEAGKQVKDAAESVKEGLGELGGVLRDVIGGRRK